MIRLTAFLMLVGLTTNAMAQFPAVYAPASPSGSASDSMTVVGSQSEFLLSDIVRPPEVAASTPLCEWTWTTGPATDISSSAATLHGTVNLCGTSMVCFFQYGLTTDYGMITQLFTVASGNDPVGVEFPVSGLMPGTLYHYRLVVKGISATVFANDTTFTTREELAPTVATSGAGLISRAGATLYGTVNPNGAGTSYHFVYGQTNEYQHSTPSAGAGSGTGDIVVSAVISGLSPGTVYHYRLVAANSAGTRSGADSAFTTLPQPALTTNGATSLTGNGAQLNGSANPNGATTSCFFQYGLTISYGSETPAVEVGSGRIPLPVQCVVNGLREGTLYHYRLAAISGGDTFYGNDTVFQTAALPPSVITTPATNISTNSADLNGTVNPNGKNTTYHFDYGLTTAYGLSTPTANAGSGTGDSAVSARVDSLSPKSLYHYRLVATNAGGTTSGSDTTFETEACSWSGLTIPPTNVKSTEAALHALLNPCSFNTSYSFQYGTTTAYGSETSPASIESGIEDTLVTDTIRRLLPNTVYHYRLAATKGGVINFGDDVSFSTLVQLPPKVTTMGAKWIPDVGAVLNGTVNPNGDSASCYFEYGPTTGYGSQTETVRLGPVTSDSSVSAGIRGLSQLTAYHYRIVGTNSGGTGYGTDAILSTTGIEETSVRPGEFELSQNFPNPFNPSTVIRYGLPSGGHVRLAVYNLLGNLVQELVNGQQQAGFHEVQFQMDNLGSGIYFYRLEADKYVAVRRMLVLK